MSQWVLGEQWKLADAAQQKEFVEQFRRLLVRTYATALLEYSDQSIAYPANEASHNPKTATVSRESSSRAAASCRSSIACTTRPATGRCSTCRSTA